MGFNKDLYPRKLRTIPKLDKGSRKSTLVLIMFGGKQKNVEAAGKK